MKKNFIIETVERNGLIIISAGIAFIYWRFDSLHPGAVFTRLFTAFLFIAYGIFTQYLINAHKCMAMTLKKAHQELLERVGQRTDPWNSYKGAFMSPGDERRPTE